MARVCVYTAIVGGFDSLKPPKVARGLDFICFADRRLSAPGWTHRRIYDFENSPRRTARRHKLLSHEYLPDYDVAIWVDGSFVVHGDLMQAVRRYLAKHSVAVRTHPWRKPSCVYAEAKACIEQKKDRAELIIRQMERYHEEGYPANNGMVDTGLLLRRHDDAGVRFNQAWWDELSQNSLRDQLSFNFASWKSGVPFHEMPNNVRRTDDWVRYIGHGQR